MLKNLTAALTNLYKNAYIRIASAILIIAIAGLTTVGDYGLTVDEGTELAMVRRNLELVTKGQPIPGDLKYFGTFFNFIAETVFQAKEFIHHRGNYNPNSYEQARSPEAEKQFRLQGLADRIKVKHPLTFLFSLIAYIAAAGLISILCGLEYAFLGPIFLALFPRFWGHTFFNPKDPPFAAMFTLCTLAGAYLVDRYVRAENPIKVGKNSLTFYAAIYGVLVGLLTSIRVGGFLVLFFVAIAHLALIISEKRNLIAEFFKYIGHYIVMVAAWMATVIILQPASWSNLCSPDLPCPPPSLSNPASWHNPVGWFFASIAYLSKHPLPITVFFEGQDIPIQQIPQHYIAKWMLISIPIIFQILLIVGFALIARKYRQFSPLQQAAVVLIALQVFCLPAVAIIKHSSAYDEVRHFMFVMPGIAAISAAAVAWIWQKLTNRNLRIFAATLLAVIFSQIAAEMISLHPYQYIYFNQLAGGLPKASQAYDTDYWGLSLREGAEWLNKNANPQEKIVVSGLFNSAKIFADPSLQLSEYEPNTDYPKPFYYLAWPRWGAPKNFPNCPVIYEIKRQNVPLSIIKRCS